jgi:protein-tyrosine phosphatase
MFRPVQLPRDVAGSLWLHSMPGRRELLEQTWEQIAVHGVQLIVCLSESDEVRAGSPSYAAAFDAKTIPCLVERFPIPDFGVPSNREAFWSLASKLATQLSSGGRVLIHCGAGIGRTGMLAVCVLLALGDGPAEAQQAVSMAGSLAVTPEQRELVSWCAAHAHSAK